MPYKISGGEYKHVFTSFCYQYTRKMFFILIKKSNDNKIGIFSTLFFDNVNKIYNMTTQQFIYLMYVLFL